MSNAMAAVPRGKGRFWPAMIVGLILMNATVVGVTVYFARNDPSVATEPNYYAKALRFGEAAELRDASARLGWKAGAAVRGVDGGHVLVLDLRDSGGEAIADARVEAVAFASVRSGERQAVTLEAVGGGRYEAPLVVTRGGLWHVEVTAARGGDRFASRSDFLVSVNGR